MAELLKNQFFQPEFLQKLAEAIQKIYPPFLVNQFINEVHDQDWQGRELKARMRHISVCLGKALPADYAQAIEILSGVASQFESFDGMIFPDFVELHGVDHYQISIKALGYFTRFSSAEFAIRPFIIRYEKETMAQMLAWADDPHPHVRRLASEGCRPRLPWAVALNSFKKDPSLVLPILEKLKDDESETVRRSVANNLNDIAKDNPEIVLEIIERWQGKSQKTDWIIKHGSRTLLKKANTSALQTFGFKSINSLKINNLQLKKSKISIGDTLEFSFELNHSEAQATKLRLEYGIDYVKAKGAVSRKIFQITEADFLPHQHYNIQKKQSFQDFSTRKHFAGTHRLLIICNGKVVDEKVFELG
jgi:3-methyladenine DNA glycosylase AlkC